VPQIDYTSIVSATQYTSLDLDPAKYGKHSDRIANMTGDEFAAFRLAIERMMSSNHDPRDQGQRYRKIM
jgi:hypothetical protein